eukprot:1161942-Pelagomonas_calceolata.AAC.6
MAAADSRMAKLGAAQTKLSCIGSGVAQAAVQQGNPLQFTCCPPVPQFAAYSFCLRVLECTSTRPISPIVWLPSKLHGGGGHTPAVFAPMWPP